MNWNQLKTILWLRWRLTRNQARRAGMVNQVITIIAAIIAILVAIGAGVGGCLVGALVLSQVQPLGMMVAWDAVGGIFLFVWALGVLAEIQRAESIELGKLFHLPVSLGGIFVMNYIASHLAFSLILFIPATMGLCAGLIYGGNLWMALLIPLVLSFIFMITAWTYCLRGWLVALMVNPRRRRNILAVITLSLVLMGQLPNIYFHLIAKPGSYRSHNHSKNYSHPDGSPETPSETLQRMVPPGLIVVHDYVPVLWLPRGAMALAERDPWPALAATMGCFLLGAVGLARAYRSTLRFYLGQDTSGKVKKTVPMKVAGAPAKNFMEKQLPFVSEDVAALTLAFFRSLSRAPEVKMALFSNLIVVVALVPIIGMKSPLTNSPTGQLFMATGLVSFTFFGLLMQMSNHFGFDRDGFRALILSPAPRKNVLLAKNLALAPIAFGIGAAVLLTLVLVKHLPPLMVLGALLKLVAMFLLLSVLGNLISVCVPYRVAAGSLKPTKPPVKTVLLIVATQLLFPIVMIPNFIPPVVGFALEKFYDFPAPVVDVLLSFCLLIIGAGVYRLSMNGLGDLLERREQKILLVVSQEVE